MNIKRTSIVTISYHHKQLFYNQAEDMVHPLYPMTLLPSAHTVNVMKGNTNEIEGVIENIDKFQLHSNHCTTP